MKKEHKKLTSKDVMIGDWILVDKNAWVDDEYDPRCGVTNYQPYLITIGEDIDDVEWNDSPAYGVPITEEILKKNFKGDEYGIYKVFHNEEIGETLFYNFPRLAIGYRPDKDSMCCELPDIKYVHELQHFLRAIKIDKEIKV